MMAFSDRLVRGWFWLLGLRWDKDRQLWLQGEEIIPEFVVRAALVFPVLVVGSLALVFGLVGLGWALDALISWIRVAF
jgi:hypothetical protein